MEDHFPLKKLVISRVPAVDLPGWAITRKMGTSWSFQPIWLANKTYLKPPPRRTYTNRLDKENLIFQNYVGWGNKWILLKKVNSLKINSTRYSPKYTFIDPYSLYGGGSGCWETKKFKIDISRWHLQTPVEPSFPKVPVTWDVHVAIGLPGVPRLHVMLQQESDFSWIFFKVTSRWWTQNEEKKTSWIRAEY